MFTSITRENSSVGTFHNGAFSVITAALLTNKSGGPESASTRAAHDFTSLSALTSTTSNECDEPQRLRSSSIAFFERAQPQTVWPAAMKPSAIASPRPRLTPVMTMSLDFESGMRAVARFAWIASKLWSAVTCHRFLFQPPSRDRNRRVLILEKR
jgi:hypothetical protein